MSDHHPEISEERLFFFDQEEVIVCDFEATGHILDIGGGGNGVIGRLKGEQVVAIDPSKQELEGAVAGPLKIIMDAADLQFLDETFDTATSFYTLLYVKETGAHKDVLAEVFRVLARGGRFLIWDAVFPPHIDEKQDIAVFPLTVKLPGEGFDVGYGAPWPEEGRGLCYYVRMAEDTGFEVVLQTEEGHRLYLELRKP